jgi:hypothetical protein
MWSGRDGEMMYTIAQTRGPRFYVTRDIKRSPFAMTRSLTGKDDGAAGRRRKGEHPNMMLEQHLPLAALRAQSITEPEQ